MNVSKPIIDHPYLLDMIEYYVNELVPCDYSVCSRCKIFEKNKETIKHKCCVCSAWYCDSCAEVSNKNLKFYCFECFQERNYNCLTDEDV